MEFTEIVWADRNRTQDRAQWRAGLGTCGVEISSSITKVLVGSF
jgi:hypothetical protein